MANYTMHHLNVGSNTYEMVDEQGRANIAPTFSTSTSYSSGDYVIYSGTLYQFTSNHTGAWTGADAEVITVAGMLDGVETTEIYVDGTSLIINTALVNGNEVSF